MQLDLGNNIRQLRRCHNRTQEALAGALGVTSQAVSRWESGGSYPDMNLIPSIANYFGVSIDELFGYESQREQKVASLIQKINAMIDENNGRDVSMDACISLARQSLIEFPGNERLMLCLASALFKAGYVRHGEYHKIDEDGYLVYDNEKNRTNPEWQEAVPIYEKLVHLLPVGSMRDRAVEELSQLYLNIGAQEKGRSLAESAPSLWNSREFLRAHAFDGKLGIQALSETLLTAIRACAQLVLNITCGYQHHLCAGEKAACLRQAIGLFELICSDGNFGVHHGYVASLHLLLSLYLWLDGKRDEAFAALDQALEHVKRLENACAQEIIRYSAPLVQMAEEKAHCTAGQVHEDLLSMPEDWPWWSVPEAAQVKAEMQADPRWHDWAARTQM